MRKKNKIDELNEMSPEEKNRFLEAEMKDCIDDVASDGNRTFVKDGKIMVVGQVEEIPEDGLDAKELAHKINKKYKAGNFEDRLES